MSGKSRIESLLADEAATVAFGQHLGKAAVLGGVIYLQGDLGAGKTTLCRGILRAFGYQGAVKSPTYTLVEPYRFDNITVYHFDLYRLADPEELEYMGIRDYFQTDTLCLIEWPARGEGFLPPADLVVNLAVSGFSRQLVCQAGTEKGRKLLSALE